jgi:hypothetical protein
MRRFWEWERVRCLRAGVVTPLPGGSGTPPGRHYDRPARSSLGWDRRSRVTPVEATSQEARAWS